MKNTKPQVAHGNRRDLVDLDAELGSSSAVYGPEGIGKISCADGVFSKYDTLVLIELVMMMVDEASEVDETVVENAKSGLYIETLPDTELYTVDEEKPGLR